MRKIMITALDVVGVVAGVAQAQEPCTACRLNPYPDPHGKVGVDCVRFTETGITPVKTTVFMFGEGVVHAPGSELAWVIVTNFDPTPQVITIELVAQGSGSPNWRQFTLAPFERFPFAVHDDDDFAGMHAFTTRVFVAGDTDAVLVMRPATDSFSRATLPAATVTVARKEGASR
jgi:hypothetical protein